MYEFIKWFFVVYGALCFLNTAGILAVVAGKEYYIRKQRTRRNHENFDRLDRYYRGIL